VNQSAYLDERVEVMMYTDRCSKMQEEQEKMFERLTNREGLTPSSGRWDVNTRLPVWKAGCHQFTANPFSYLNVETASLHVRTRLATQR